MLTIDIIGDEECISHHIYPLPPDSAEPAQKLKDIYEIGLLSPKIVTQIDWQNEPQKNRSSSQYGKLESFSQTEDGNYVASGWVYALPSKPSLDAVILAYQVSNSSRTAFAIANLAIENKDRWELLLDPRHVKLNWQKSLAVTVPRDRSQIVAWAFDTNNGKAYPLQGVADL